MFARNCADNSGAKNLYIIAVIGIGGRLNKLPNCSPGDLVLCSVKKASLELRVACVFRCWELILPSCTVEVLIDARDYAQRHERVEKKGGKPVKEGEADSNCW